LPLGGSVARLEPVIRPASIVLALVAGVALVAPAHGAASDGDEVRVRGSCGAGARSELRLRAEDDGIELRFDVARAGGPGTWRVAVVHERRVAWKGTVRVRGSGRSFTVRRVLPDLDGADAVTVRAWGSQGAGCRATGTLSGD
jgi:hypothetical protein